MSATLTMLTRFLTDEWQHDRAQRLAQQVFLPQLRDRDDQYAHFRDYDGAWMYCRHNHNVHVYGDCVRCDTYTNVPGANLPDEALAAARTVVADMVRRTRIVVTAMTAAKEAGAPLPTAALDALLTWVHEPEERHL